MQLLVLDTNAAVVPFYERLGFEVVPRIVMSKKLEAGLTGMPRHRSKMKTE
jgi:ribosomal protein S18 acetylase RimI-like enzyme